MYTEKDISVVIPNYNRLEDLKETLKSILSVQKNILEILIVDQSSDDSIKKYISKLSNNKVKYIRSDPPAITVARNLGVSKSSKSSKIICFLDNDVTLPKNYFSEILAIFNSNNDAKGAAAYFDPPKESPFLTFLKKLFFLQRFEENRADFVSPYGNIYPSELSNTIKSEWLPGVNMCYLKSIFKDQKFDEKLLGYTISEDIDFSYRLNKKFPGSLYITPKAKIIHRASQEEREPTEKISYINQVDHYYFYKKNMSKNFSKRAKFYWSLLGISIMRSLLALLTLKKNNYLKMKFFFLSLNYVLKNKKKISSGNVRDFNLS